MSKSNYTTEQVAELVAAYNESVTDELRVSTMEHYAAMWDKSVPSIRSKLVAEGVYIAKGKPKASSTSKDALATAIGIAFQMTEAQASSLASARKDALQVIWNKVSTFSGDVTAES